MLSCKARDEKLEAAQRSAKMAGRPFTSREGGRRSSPLDSVTNNDIAESLKRIGFEVLKAQVRMPDGPLKVVGEHVVSVSPHTDVVVEVNVVVIGETQ